MSNTATVTEPTAIVTPATPAPVTTTLTAAEKKEADQRWADKTEYFRQMKLEAAKKVLTLYWQKGQFVEDLIRSARHYGNRTIENFAEALGESVEAIYQCHRYYQRCRMEEVEWQVKHEISWRNIVYLLSVENTEKRAELQEKLVEKKIDHEELKALVKKINKVTKKAKAKKGEKVSNQGGLALKTIFRSTVTISVDLSRKLDEFKDGYRQFSKLDEGKQKSELAITLKEAFKAMADIHKRIGSLIELKDKQ